MITLHLIANEGTTALETWKHINFHEWFNTALSSDHIFAEGVMTLLVDGLLIWGGGKLFGRFLKRHDQDHADDLEVRLAELEASFNCLHRPAVEFRDLATEMGVI
jgi:hypothetical protein